MFQVANLRNGAGTKAKYTKLSIDRTSALGNPFFMKDESMRNEVCDKFEIYARNELKMNKTGKFYAAFKELYLKFINGEDLSLMCWCAPKRCHGDVLVKLLNEFKVKNNH